MIYTVTFNPALDYTMTFDRITCGSVNRTTAEHLHIGGKGINVSLILRELGIATCAWGFVAGFTGAWLEDTLRASGILCDFVRLKEGHTRINVKLNCDNVTDLNARGPTVSADALYRFEWKLDSLRGGDTVVLSGSAPESANDVYESITSKLAAKKIRFVADATGDQLRAALKHRPFLVKPNHHELADLFGVKIETEAEVITYAGKLREMGAQNVLVSCGREGALLLDEYGRFHKTGIVQDKPVNAVGAGDSMVAGFLAGYLSRGDYGYALRLGSAAGNATALTEGLGRRDDILRLMEDPALQLKEVSI
ncbi:MAG: 1-phosphofructokinase [Clostridia bacterium]|nr:1-phosphofructokinase [Clostridia bacterium]